VKRTTLVVIAFGLFVGGCQTCAGGDDSSQQQQQTAPNAPAKSGSPRHLRAPLMGVTHTDGAAVAPADSAASPDGGAAP
jgi:hypothetical protein